MNRRTLMTLAAGAPLMTAVPALGQTSLAPDDRTAIAGWLEDYAAGWAAGDGGQMYRMATDDLEWVNIVGMHWRGKPAVVAAHDVYLGTMFKGVPFTLRGIESLRPVGPDVVLAVVRWSVGAFTAPDGAVIPATDDRMTLVFRRTPDGLRLAHGANIQIDPVAANFDPSKGPPGG